VPHALRPNFQLEAMEHGFDVLTGITRLRKFHNDTIHLCRCPCPVTCKSGCANFWAPSSLFIVLVQHTCSTPLLGATCPHIPRYDALLCYDILLLSPHFGYWFWDYSTLHWHPKPSSFSHPLLVFFSRIMNPGDWLVDRLRRLDSTLPVTKTTFLFESR
jgi:hypothetical protein